MNQDQKETWEETQRADLDGVCRFVLLLKGALAGGEGLADSRESLS